MYAIAETMEEDDKIAGKNEDGAIRFGGWELLRGLLPCLDASLNLQPIVWY